MLSLLMLHAISRHRVWPISSLSPPMLPFNLGHQGALAICDGLAPGIHLRAWHQRRAIREGEVLF